MVKSKAPEPLTGVAVIGMSGRFPGAKSVDAFWQNLRDGVDAIAFFSDAEVVASGVAPETLRNPDYVKAGAVLKDPEWFDAAFFGVSPREAEIMDPQQRIFLECAWEALEHAGYDSEIYAGRIGVYAGVSLNTYALNLYSRGNRDETTSNFQALLANDKDFLATRVSYKLGLTGPSIGVQTACSTSLVAIHLACQNLLYGECDIALAGGASVKFPQKAGYLYQEGGILSPDGRCRAFDARAQGTVGGSGVGIVVLKRLSEAVADGDTIHAVIIGSAINNDGAVKVGFTAPSVAGQADVIAEAQAVAEVDPESISYIEAHGTGTPLGDPIEFAALAQAFRSATGRGFCALGSVKTNIGHLDAAAGVAGFIKTVLALEHKTIPPSLHFSEPNPQIDFTGSPFYVNTTVAPWQARSLPRRAGVSSFGIGGTNAHVILEEAPAVAPAEQSPRPQVLLLSARTMGALENATQNLITHLTRHPELSVADAAYTLQVGRRRLSHRRFVVCRTTDDAVAALAAADAKRVVTAVQESVDRAIVFMFPGQGAQYVNMAAQLYRIESSFRKELDTCAELLFPELEFDLRSVLYPDGGQTREAAVRLNRTDVTQPALFAVEYALAKLWMHWGMRPGAMIGHSLGEFVAACLAGVFSLRDALDLVATRGRLMNGLPAGAMLAVPLPEAALREHLSESLSLAAINGPSSCVVSGPAGTVERLRQELARKDILCRRLHTSHAFHSAMMDPILPQFAERLKTVKLQPPKIPFVSNVSGTWISEEQAVDTDYWVRHLRHTVRFSDGLGSLLRGSSRLFLEIGPGQTMSSLTRQHPDKTAEHGILSSLPHAQDTQSDAEFLVNTLGRLWLAGARIDWPQVHGEERRRRVPLPTYPFEHQRFSLAAAPAPHAALARQAALRKQPDLADWFYVPSWKRAQAERPSPQRNMTAARWLVFNESVGMSADLAPRLRRLGYEVVTVTAGARFARLDGHAYTIDPRQRDDYTALLRDLSASGKNPNGILHLWSVAPDESAASASDFADKLQALGFYSLLSLVQAIGEVHLWDPLKLMVVTSGVHDVTGMEPLCPEKATVLGPCKVIPQEYPNIKCCCIDIEVPAGGSDQRLLLERLLAEVNIATEEPVVALRGRHRWVQTFEPVRLAQDPNTAVRLRQGGVYLITGGLGGLGLAVAEFFARELKAKLILTARTPFPGRDEWQGWLGDRAAKTSEENGSATVEKKIRRLQKIEQLGAEVLVASADVAVPEQMEAAVAAARRRFGTIHGIVHAAGILSDGIMQLKQAGVAADVLAPKLAGTRVLEAVSKEMRLDFLVLFSSLRSIVGGVGVADYAAANAFLDAYAHDQAARNGIFTVSVNWGVWRDDGMSARGAAHNSAARTAAAGPLLLEEGMSSEEGTEALRRILGASLPQVVVSTQDFKAVTEQFEAMANTGLRTDATDPNLSSQVHARPETAATYAAPTNRTERILADIWQELLGIDRIGINDNFFELGGDSVIGLGLVTKAHKAGIRLTNRQIFEHQTIAELAAVAETGQVRLNAEQGEAMGAAPLTPIQLWFLEQPLPDPNHWNMAITVEAKHPLDVRLLEAAVEKLIAHHDALRLRFVQEKGHWRQRYVGDNHVGVTRLDLSGLTAAEREFAQERAATQLQSSLNLSSGALFRVLLFDFGAGAPSRLLLVCHHLVVDIGSWRILLDDLAGVYEQLSKGEEVELPPKTDSYKHWAECIARYARSSALQGEAKYWLAARRSQVGHLPSDFFRGGNSAGSVQEVARSLNLQETRMLFQASESRRAPVHYLLLTALAMAFKTWTAAHSFVVDLEEDGREALFEGVDVSRTVGWFTTVYPALLDLEGAADHETAFCSIRDQLRAVPCHGIGYGLLRYLPGNETIADQLQSLPQAETTFLYLGRLDESLGSAHWVQRTDGIKGPERSPGGKRRHIFEIIASVSEAGALTFQWLYSANLHRRSTVESVAQAAVDALRMFLDPKRTLVVPGHRAADFPAARLDQKELEQFIASITKTVRGN
jgi:non-ribosomal peptide synthase protein (TIGR01720 family)